MKDGTKGVPEGAIMAGYVTKISKLSEFSLNFTCL